MGGAVREEATKGIKRPLAKGERGARGKTNSKQPAFIISKRYREVNRK